jgi:hypothetical protein
MKWLIPISVTVLCITLAVCAVVLTWNIRIGIHNANDIGQDVKEYVHAEKATLEDPRNAKAIEAATQVGAVFNASGRLLNTQTLPRANKVLDALTAEAVALKVTTDESTRQLRQNGDSANGVLVAARSTVTVLGAVADKLGIDMGTLTLAIQKTSDTANLTVAEITKRVADPKFDEVLDGVLAAETSLTHVAGEVALASDRLPEIAADLRKVTKASGRFANAYWIAKILAILLPLVP